MKLLSLHINNYGKLSNYDYDFKDVSVFCEDNGFGKSTIASFIKAMLYGLDTYKANSKFNDRKHFYPFKGGVFGGNIILEYNNHNYRIERTFDEKSSTNDSLKVYCDSNPTSDLGDIPGITIFGVNRDSFERLISIDSKEITIETDSDINRKLNNYVDNVGEDFHIDKVIEELKKKKKSNKEKFSNVSGKIKDLKIDIKNLEIINSSLDDKYLELNNLETAKTNSIEEYSKASSQGTIIEKWKNYESLEKEIEEKNSELKEIASYYPNGIPSDSDVQLLKELNQNIAGYDMTLQNNSNSLTEKNEFDRLSQKYKKHIPNDEELQEVEYKINDFENRTKRIKEIESSEKSTKEIELEKHFFGEVPTDASIDGIEEEIKGYLKTQNELNNIKPTIFEKEMRHELDNKHKSKGLFLSLIVASLVLLGIGIGLLFVIQVFGIILLILGVGALVTDMFLYFNSSLKSIKGSSEVSVEKSNPEYENKKDELERQRNKVLNLFANYRYNGDNVEVLLYQFKNDVKEYQEIISSKSINNDELRENHDVIATIKSELNSFFNLVNMQEISYKEALNTIKADLVKYYTLKRTVQSVDKTREETENAKNNCIKDIKGIYKKYGVNFNKTIESIDTDVNDINRLKNEIEKKKKQATDYKEQNNLDIKPEIKEYNLDNMKQDMDEKISDYNKLKQEIEDLENQVLSLDDKKQQLQTYLDDKNKFEDNINIFDSLMQELQNADQKLKDRYISPIRDKFVYYANLLEKAIGEKISMDKNYRVSFDRDGELRSCEHLSSGNLTICALCFRLALLDNMFETDKPFILMDDPFMNLDANHFKKTKDLISMLSKDKQIIYFCCHNSRLI